MRQGATQVGELHMNRRMGTLKWGCIREPVMGDGVPPCACKGGGCASGVAHEWKGACKRKLVHQCFDGLLDPPCASWDNTLKLASCHVHTPCLNPLQSPNRVITSKQESSTSLAS